MFLLLLLLLQGVENNGSVTRVATFPIGIDPERFTRSLETEEVQGHIAKLLSRYAGRKVRPPHGATKDSWSRCRPRWLKARITIPVLFCCTLSDHVGR